MKCSSSGRHVRAGFMAFLSCNMTLYLKTEPKHTSKTLVSSCIYKLIQRLITEVCNVNNNSRGNLKSQKQRIIQRFRVRNARVDGQNRSITHNVHTFRNESVEVAYGLDRVELNETVC
jgi:hypothetical protein